MQLNNSKILTKPLFTFLAVLCTIFWTFAQDGDGKLLDVDINVGRQEWYENPWIWVGVAVFVLLLALILKKK